MDLTGGLGLVGIAGAGIAILVVLHSLWCVRYARKQWPIDRRLDEVTRR